MTKKDYILIAEMLKQNRQKIKMARTEKRKITIDGIVKAIERDVADLLFKDNQRFDYARFMNYIAE